MMDLAQGRSLLFHQKLSSGLCLDEVIGKAVLLESEKIFDVDRPDLQGAVT
jgi:hypothetical protein